MNLKAIGFYMGHILRLLGILIAPALIISLFGHEWSAAVGLGVAMAAMIGSGCLLFFCRRPGTGGISQREGYVTVALGWILISLFGALPFWISGYIPHFIDAFFEVVSGFTTTGATILKDVEALPNGLLYWRSFTHWIGGMGVLVFILAIVPLGKGNGESFHLLRAESPGPSVGKLTPTMKHTASTLYIIYFVLTLILIVLLLLGDMPLFDSVLTAFGTAGTGGFAIKNASIAAYDSYYLQTVIAIFMALFGINFNLYYLVLVGRASQALKSEEFRTYIGIMLTATVIITINIFGIYGNVRDALHHSFFQVSSIMTTTGFCTADFDKWPELSRMILLGLMIVGASAGSTGGGIKVARALILWRSLKVEAKLIVRPRTVSTICIDKKQIDDFVLRGVYAFTVAYITICAVSMFAVSLDNFDLETTLSSVFACIGNIGPGLSMVGATGNYSEFSVLSKLVLSADMLFGRLEIFPLLLVFAPSVWKRRK